MLVQIAVRRPFVTLCFRTIAKSGPGLATASACATATFENSSQKSCIARARRSERALFERRIGQHPVEMFAFDECADRAIFRQPLRRFVEQRTGVVDAPEQSQHL